MPNQEIRETGRARVPSGRHRAGRGRHSAQQGSNWWPVFFLPLAFMYMELIFHLFMGLHLKYLLIVLPFAFSLGMVCSLLTINFPEKVNKTVLYVLTGLVSFLFCVEVVCKTCLAQYYQIFSTLGTAAENQLTDYIDAIIDAIFGKLHIILLLFVPLPFGLIYGRKRFCYKRKQPILNAVVVVLFILTHLFGLLMLRLPWGGSVTPREVYATDTNVEDQVDQLGLLTMIRLDAKHLLFGVKRELDTDFDVNLPVNPSPDAAQSPDAQAPVGSDDPNPAVTDGPEVTPYPYNTDFSPNVMDLDFDALIAASKNQNTEWLNKYFASKTPTNRNKYTGYFEGYNVIQICAEGLTGYLLDPELTPTLWRLAHEGFVFNNFYTPLHYTSTSGGEFQLLTGLYPKDGNPISMKYSGQQKSNLYFSLAQQLGREGYLVTGYHANHDIYGRLASHLNLGYDWKQGGHGFELEKSSSGKELWPQSDLYLMEHSVDDYINSTKPFHVYYMTISGHMPFNFSGHQMSIRNKSAVADLPYSDVTKAYIAANLELEKGLAYLVQRLEEAGIADRTVIVLTPDHIPYFNPDTISELAGRDFGGTSEELSNINETHVDLEIYHSSLIIWSASMEEPVEVDKVCCPVDILPTISNLLGLEYDSRMMCGQDILSDAEGLVIMRSRSFITDRGRYNRYTGTFTPAPGVSMSDAEIEEYVAAMKKIVNNQLQTGAMILECNYYQTVFKNQ